MNNKIKFERLIENADVLFTNGDLDIQKCVEEIVKTSTLHYESAWDTDQKYLWVLISWKINFHKIPKKDEKLKIITEVIGHVGFFIVRNFKVYSEELLIDANSVWTIIDDKSRSIIRIPKNLTDEYKKIKRSELDLYLPSIDIPVETSSKSTITPTQNDIDSNGHVNNAVYFNWLQNSIMGYSSDILLDKKINVLYKKEILVNEQLCINTIDFKSDIFMIVTNKENEELKAIIEMTNNKG